MGCSVRGYHLGEVFGKCINLLLRRRRAARMVLNSRSSTTRVSFSLGGIGLQAYLSGYPWMRQKQGSCGRGKSSRESGKLAQTPEQEDCLNLVFSARLDTSPTPPHNLTWNGTEGPMGPHEPKVERRLAAIFAADVAGYSRLMEQDEVGTLRTLTTHREIMDRLIVEHGGRMPTPLGDSVLAEFPSAVEAVQCAVEHPDCSRSGKPRHARGAPRPIPDWTACWRCDGPGWRPVGRRREHRRPTGKPC